MTPPEDHARPFHLSDTPDADIAKYRAMCALAIAGLVLGLASPTAFLDPLLWAVPICGTIVSAAALSRIARNPSLTGRRMALAGLWLSVVFAVAGPADWYVYWRLLRSEARQFAAVWFRDLQQGQPQKAYQLTLLPAKRGPRNDELWDFYRNSPESRKELEVYVQAPLQRTLLALGPKAVVQYYGCGGQDVAENAAIVDLVYAISYDDPPQGKKTFFANLGLERLRLDDGRAGWRLVHADAGNVKLPGW
jgi:hypothetical protein